MSLPMQLTLERLVCILLWVLNSGMNTGLPVSSGSRCLSVRKCIRAKYRRRMGFFFSGTSSRKASELVTIMA